MDCSESVFYSLKAGLNVILSSEEKVESSNLWWAWISVLFAIDTE